MNALERLHTTLSSAGIPIHGVSGTSALDVVVSYTEAATPQDQADGATIVSVFDWSTAADETYLAQQEKARAADAIDYGALKRGTRDERLIRALALAVLDRFNATALKYNALLDAIDASASLAALKTAVGQIADIPQLTPAQLVGAIKAQIAATGE